MFVNHPKKIIIVAAGAIALIAFLTSARTTAPSHTQGPDTESGASRSEIYTVILTAYASVPEQTDNRPEETAAQTEARDGIVAANFLPFGALIKIPEFFGDKIFVVEDRLHPGKDFVVDVWMPNKKSAKEFGAHLTDILVIQKPDF